MKNIYIICILFIGLNAHSQVGIGTTSPNAQLDVRSSNQATPANTDGILIPKVDAFPAVNPTAVQQGILLYLTTTTTFASVSRSPGFYYWDNPTSNWISIQTNPTSSWNLIGNSGTNPSTNFIGSTDDKDIVFKRNNIRSGFIGNPNTTSGNKNTAFGANTLNAATTGTRNTALGTNTLPSNSTGNMNVTIGDQSMFTNTSGSENVAIGVGTLYSNSSGVSNVAVGRNALTNNNGTSGSQGCNNTGIGYVALRSNTIGAFNSALGRDALYTNSTGNNNVGLGYQAGYSNSTGSNNVFLGNQAGYNEITSNKLYIENSNADANNALIYGEFDNNITRVNGQLQISNPATTGYALPTSRGTTGQILQTDGSGGTNWVDLGNTLSIVRANLSANQSLGTGGWQKINFDTVVFDTKSEFNTTNGRFTAIKAGYYEINAGYHTFNQFDTNYYAIAVYKNGSEYQETASHHFGSNLISRTINCIVYLNAGEFIEIYAHNISNGTTLDAYSGKTYFEVKQIK